MHPSDWPYERAPLAAQCAAGWAAIAAACHAHGATVIASLDHAGGQGSSAYSQRELWAPSRVPEVNAREVPKWMEADDIAAVVARLRRRRRHRRRRRLRRRGDQRRPAQPGAPVPQRPHQPPRRRVGPSARCSPGRSSSAVRAAVGDAVVGLRLSCDELAPWAGITPEMAPAIAAELVAEGIDYVVVVRGSIFSVEKTRADFHEPVGYNIDVCRAGAGRAARAHRCSCRARSTPPRPSGPSASTWPTPPRSPAARSPTPTSRQAGRPGSSTASARASAATRRARSATAATPSSLASASPPAATRPTTPTGSPSSPRPRDVVVVGGGVAGLETARVAAARGHHVRIVEQSRRARRCGRAAPPRRAARRLAGPRVRRRAGHRAARAPTTLDATADEVVVQCTGARPGRCRSRCSTARTWSTCSTRGTPCSTAPTPLARRRAHRPVRPHRRPHRRRPRRTAGRPRRADHPGPDRRQRAVRAPATSRRPTPASPSAASASSAGRCCAWPAPARSSWRTASAASDAPSRAWPWSTAASACPPTRCPTCTTRPATASPRAPSWKPCSKAARACPLAAEVDVRPARRRAVGHGRHHRRHRAVLDRHRVRAGRRVRRRVERREGALAGGYRPARLGRHHPRPRRRRPAHRRHRQPPARRRHRPRAAARALAPGARELLAALRKPRASPTHWSR